MKNETNQEGGERMEVATTILRQLGGNRFIAMTGSKNFAASDNSLSMKLGRNQSGATHLRVTLNALDLYDMKFVSVRGASIKTKKEYNGVYCDQLQRLFTEATGLYTTL